MRTRTLEAKLAAAREEIAQLEARLGSSLDPFDLVDVAEMSLHSAHPGATGAHEIDTANRVPLPEWGAVKPCYGTGITLDIPPNVPVRFIGCWGRDGRYLGCLRLKNVSATPSATGGTLTVTLEETRRIVSA